MAESFTSPEIFSEHAKLIMTLRSGKILNQLKVTQQSKQPMPTTSEKKNPKEREEPVNPTPIPKAPLPSALENPLPMDKKRVKMNEMLELFKQVHINLPLLNAIK